MGTSKTTSSSGRQIIIMYAIQVKKSDQKELSQILSP